MNLLSSYSVHLQVCAPTFFGRARCTIRYISTAAAHLRKLRLGEEGRGGGKMTRKRARGSRLSAVGVPLLVLALALDLVARMGEARMGSKLFSESPPEPDSKFSNKYVNEVSFSLNTEKDNPSLWIETLSWKPRAFVIHNMLTDEECDHMIRQGEVTIDRSTVVPHSDNRSSATSESRTSYGSFVNRYATETLGRIEEATAILTGIHMANGESLQILRYENGQQYKRHNDYFPEDYLREEDGMQRIATILFYLSDVEEGGETNFPEGTVLREYSERNLGTSGKTHKDSDPRERERERDPIRRLLPTHPRFVYVVYRHGERQVRGAAASGGEAKEGRRAPVLRHGSIPHLRGSLLHP